jgi:hypothetical protein
MISPSEFRRWRKARTATEITEAHRKLSEIADRQLEIYQRLTEEVRAIVPNGHLADIVNYLADLK